MRMMSKPARWAGLTLLLLASTAVSVQHAAQAPSVAMRAADDELIAYVCPMHLDYTAEIPGSCPFCGMDLVRTAPYDVRDYRLEIRTKPAVVKPGVKTTVHLKVTHPSTGATITEFETVHERRFHFFVISQDMEHFEHIHPEQQEDGTWMIDVTLPKAGYYKLLSDFFPRGGSSQFIARPLVTAGYAGDLAADSARLVPDRVLTKTVDDLTAEIVVDPPAPTAAQYAHLTYTLKDKTTGRPVTDLQTYLGAFGHALIISEDMTDYVHAHPVDLLAAAAAREGSPPQFTIPPGTDLEAIRGGPEVIFEGLMPRPGRYRAWTQFRRNDRISTFAFTFEVFEQLGP
jgi:hypothetical protein